MKYNTLTGLISASPFDPNCMNRGDKLLMATAFMSPICGLTYNYFARNNSPTRRLGEKFRIQKDDVTAEDMAHNQFNFEMVKDIIRSEQQLDYLIEGRNDTWAAIKNALHHIHFKVEPSYPFDDNFGFFGSVKEKMKQLFFRN